MARRCASEAILNTLRDPRVVTMPAAAQALWIRIVTAMQKSEISVLRFGSDIMNRTELALFIQIAETEIEQHLERLLARGLLERDRDGALVCPMLAAAKTRSEINRANGLRGGRPRKPPPAPGQGELMMPINGGRMESKITESETESGSETGAASGALLTYLSSKEEVSEQSVVSDEVYASVGLAVLDAVGADPAKSFLTYKPVRQWLADGADRELILGVINEVMARPKPPRITDLRYFNGIIADALAKRLPKKPQWKLDWQAAYDHWQLFGRGERPMPMLDDFKPKEQAA